MKIFISGPRSGVKDLNNAAFFANIVKKPFHEISASEWDKVISVNLKGPFLCAKAVYPQMKKQGKGKIINISSGTWYVGVPFFLHYVTTKAGIVGFTRSLATEVGDDGICVNSIAPGFTETDILKKKPLLILTFLTWPTEKSSLMEIWL